MQNFFFKIIEKALNQYLLLDSESNSRLELLNDKIVTMELLGINIIFQLHVLDGAIYVRQKDFIKPDTYITGTPFSLLRLALTRGDRKSFFSDDVSIVGNLEIGQQIIDLFDHLEIDWEEYASRWLGDVTSHQLGRFIQKLKSFNERTAVNMTEQVNEYIHEEAEWFPSREALQDFFSDVDTLRMDVDRIEARVARLRIRK